MPKRPLTPAEVLAIRRMCDSGTYTARSIARLYGCAAETVARIGRRETWAWLSEAPAEHSSEEDRRVASLPQGEDASASLERLMKELDGAPSTGEEK